MPALYPSHQIEGGVWEEERVSWIGMVLTPFHGQGWSNQHLLDKASQDDINWTGPVKITLSGQGLSRQLFCR